MLNFSQEKMLFFLKKTLIYMIFSKFTFFIIVIYTIRNKKLKKIPFFPLPNQKTTLNLPTWSKNLFFLINYAFRVGNYFKGMVNIVNALSIAQKQIPTIA